jgi:tRNA (adenine57-N1/adenine58-N1)-methyltransferase
MSLYHHAWWRRYVLRLRYLSTTSNSIIQIYPDDANVIVNLLDLHPDVPPALSKPGGTYGGDTPKVAGSTAELNACDAQHPKIEIFECGTGHGALTLHLARAIHAANPRVHVCDDSNDSLSEEQLLSHRKQERRAIIHTIDISAKHSKRAQEIIKGFKKGKYFNDVDFHVGQPKEFFATRKSEPFLSHAILDMPDAHEEMATVAPYVHLGGKVALFVPSITQILDAQRTVRQQNIPLYLENVLELGGGISGGREWSVKFVQSRASMRAASPTPAAEVSDDITDPADAQTTSDLGTIRKEPEWFISCRPKPGKVIQGGGFIGLWTRIESRGGLGDVDTAFSKGLREAASSSTSSSASSIASDGEFAV